MRIPPMVHVVVLVTAVSLAAGCSAAAGHDPASSHPLQLRLVTASTTGPCSLPALKTDGAGSACDRGRTTTYQLGEPLGTLTPTTVRRDGQAANQSVVVQLAEGDAATLRRVTTDALTKQVAILLDGRVLTAPVVNAPITTASVELAFPTAAEADDVAAELNGASS